MSTLRNITAGIDLSSTMTRASTPLERVLGLLRRPRVNAQEGLWLQPCSAIHTIGMRATIDVILLDRQGTVVKLRPDIRPNCLVVSHHRAHAVIEMGAGFLTSARVAVGDRLALVDGPTVATQTRPA